MKPFTDPCDGCANKPQSLAGMFQSAVSLGIVELSGVGFQWDDPNISKGCRCIIYTDSKQESADGASGEEAIRRALDKLESKT